MDDSASYKTPPFNAAIGKIVYDQYVEIDTWEAPGHTTGPLQRSFYLLSIWEDD